MNDNDKNSVFQRILSTGSIRYKDIKIMSPAMIRVYISPDKAYYWLVSRKWTKKDFDKWFEAVMKKDK